MDLLSKLHIAEKNITILIARLVHQDCFNTINRQYHKMFSLSSQQHRLLYVGDTLNRNTIAFNFRPLPNIGWSLIWVVVRKGNFHYEKSAYSIPSNYIYSSGKSSQGGFLDE